MIPRLQLDLPLEGEPRLYVIAGTAEDERRMLISLTASNALSDAATALVELSCDLLDAEERAG